MKKNLQLRINTYARKLFFIFCLLYLEHCIVIVSKYGSCIVHL